MPEISRSYGIVIKMFYDDHSPAHFHAEYAVFEALVDISRLAVFAGSLPPRALGMVIEWTSLHQKELLAQWETMRDQGPFRKIPPLP